MCIIRKQAKFLVWLLIGVWFWMPVWVGGAERPRVARIYVEGANRVSEERVLGWVVMRSGTSLDSSLVWDDLNRILAGYRQEGFWQVEAEAPEIRVTNGRASVVFRVHEGLLTRVQELKVTGNRAIGIDVLKNILGVKLGAPLVERQVAAGLEALVGFYETQGYPFCAVYPDLDV